jgi:hypothetical protein
MILATFVLLSTAITRSQSLSLSLCFFSPFYSYRCSSVCVCVCVCVFLWVYYARLYIFLECFLHSCLHSVLCDRLTKRKKKNVLLLFLHLYVFFFSFFSLFVYNNRTYVRTNRESIFHYEWWENTKVLILSVRKDVTISHLILRLLLTKLLDYFDGKNNVCTIERKSGLD